MENEKVETHGILNLNFNLEYCRANGITKSDIKRFWEKIDFPDDLVEGCWEWNAGKNNGYGDFWLHDGQIGAHRFSYNIFKGEIDSGKFIRHKRDNPSCVNPHHLLIGTQQDNMNDKVDRNRQSKGEHRYNAAFTDLKVWDILMQLVAGESKRNLATHYDVHLRTINAISKGDNWKCIFDKLTSDQKKKIIENNRKLSPKDTKKIRELYRTNYFSMNMIGDKFNVSQPTISKVIKRLKGYDY